jgi:hypothetical protein
MFLTLLHKMLHQLSLWLYSPSITAAAAYWLAGRLRNKLLQ